MSTTQSLPRHVLANKPDRDGLVWVVAVVATLISIVAFIVAFQRGVVLVYNDAISHMEIARRVTEGTNNGLAQLGGVWLPLPHVLSLPFISVDGLYYSGFAGSIVSMVSFVVSTVLIYKIITRLPVGASVLARRLGGVVGVLAFALNVNVLYMASTPMTELLLFVTLLGAVYCLVMWSVTQKVGYLAGMTISCLLATLTRYESWPITIGLLVVVGCIAWRRSKGLTGQERRGLLKDYIICAGVIAFAGVAGWLLWNQVLFGDFLNFKGGEYAKPSLWLTNNEPTVGNFWLSVKTLWYALIENVPWPLVVVAAAGLVMMLIRERLAGRVWAVLMIVIAVVPFLTWALYTGERPLHVEQVHGDLYNTRFGLIMVLPVAILVGYLVARINRKFVTFLLAACAIGSTVGISVAMLTSGDIVTLRDPQVALTQDRAVRQAQATQALQSLYDGGSVLIESFGNERLAFEAVPSNQMVYEGTNDEERWKRSLKDPSGMGIRWVVMRCTPGYRDKVCENALANPGVLRDYKRVYLHPDEQAFIIYRHN